MVRAGDRYFTEVERDDGAVVRLRGPGAHGLPHDLVHYVVESELHVDRGFWGKVSRGENVGKIEYVRAPSPAGPAPQARTTGQGRRRRGDRRPRASDPRHAAGTDPGKRR